MGLLENPNRLTITIKIDTNRAGTLTLIKQCQNLTAEAGKPVKINTVGTDGNTYSISFNLYSGRDMLKNGQDIFFYRIESLSDVGIYGMGMEEGL